MQMKTVNEITRRTFGKALKGATERLLDQPKISGQATICILRVCAGIRP